MNVERLRWIKILMNKKIEKIKELFILFYVSYFVDRNFWFDWFEMLKTFYLKLSFKFNVDNCWCKI